MCAQSYERYCSNGGRQCVKTTWPTLLNNNVELKPYYVRRSELSVQDDCVIWGSRVIVPPKLCKNILHELRQAHPLIVRMKTLARSYFWWPLIDTDIESVVKECSMCQQRHKTPAASPLHHWEWLQEPWSRLHIDYAGPIRDKMLLIIVDVHSKWIDVHTTNSSTASVTIQTLLITVSTHGLPRTMCFTSSDFEQFVK